MHSSFSSISSILARSHAIFSKVELYYAGVLQSAQTSALRVVSGSVEVSYDSAVRRTARLVVVDPTGLLMPSVGSSAGLSPYGAELRLYRGTALFPTDEPVWTPLGVFGLSANDIDDNGAQVMSITCYDRARTISRNKFTRPYIVAAGQNAVDAIVAIVQFASPAGLSFTVNAGTTSAVTPSLVFDAGADPWESATSLAQSIGYEVFFDVSGNLVIEQSPLTGALFPSGWELVEGDNSVMLGVTSSLDDEPGYNGVVVYGENSTNTEIVRGEAWDDNPSSPTYYKGPYGAIPKVINSPYVTDADSANAAARTELAKIMGDIQAVSAAAIPNPAIDIHDVVPVTRSNVNLSANMRVTGFNVPLTAREAQQLTLSQLKAVSVT